MVILRLLCLANRTEDMPSKCIFLVAFCADSMSLIKIVDFLTVRHLFSHLDTFCAGAVDGRDPAELVDCCVNQTMINLLLRRALVRHLAT